VAETGDVLERQEQGDGAIAFHIRRRRP
jgi:hypothetical protein